MQNTAVKDEFKNKLSELLAVDLPVETAQEKESSVAAASKLTNTNTIVSERQSDHDCERA